MASAAVGSGTGSGLARTFWLLFVLASLWFLYDAFTYALSREMQEGATVWNRIVWYVGHIGFASPIVLIAPLQFMPGLRQRRPDIHRRLGQIFLVGCLIAAPLGAYLGATLDLPGSRIPLTVLGSIWFFFSAVAWQAARRRDFATHRKFAIRSFAMGAAFVWVRMISQVQDEIFGFMPDEALRETTKEWITLLLPILVTEIWLSWGAVARRLFLKPAPAGR